MFQLVWQNQIHMMLYLRILLQYEINFLFFFFPANIS